MIYLSNLGFYFGSLHVHSSSNSSKHFNDESGLIRKFGWQEGYGAFTVSPNQTEVVIRYIQNQESHHRGETFQEEYVRMLDLAGVEYDPQYLWH